MKVNVMQPLKGYDGTEVVENGKPVPVRTFMLNALAVSAPDPNDPSQQLRMTTESKEQRFAISSKLWSKKNVDLSVKEASFILECVDAAYDNPLICGRIKQVLEGEGQSVPESDEATPGQASSDRPKGDEARG